MKIFKPGSYPKLEKKIGTFASTESTQKRQEEYIQRIKDQALEYYREIEKDNLKNYNINKQRVDSFLKTNNLSIPEHILFLTKRDCIEIGKIYTDKGYYAHFLKNDKSIGFYDLTMGMTYVFSDHEFYTNLNEKSLVQEACAIHESVHNNSGYDISFITEKEDYNGKINRSNHTTRTGMNIFNLLTDKEYGDFFEEGIARYMEAIYIKQYRDSNLTRDIEAGQKQERYPFNSIQSGFYIGNKEGSYSTYVHSNSGMGMDLLFKAKPELFDAFIKARQMGGDIAALRKIAQIIDSIKLPKENNKERSLYVELRKLNAIKDAKCGLNLIIEALKYSKPI